MQQIQRLGSTDADRRWAGAFRLCTSCGGRNWVGERRCRKCGALLLGARAVARPPVAMVGRRAADRVFTPRVKAIAGGAAVLAMISGAVLLQIFRTDGFQDRPLPQPAEATAAVTPETSDLDAPLTARPGDAARALRAADRGRRLLDAGQVRAAVVLLADAVHVRPDDAELAHLYGAALWEFGARDRALFQLQRALLLAPEAEAYRQDVARALQALGRTAQAAHVLQGTSVLPAGVGDGSAAAIVEAPPLGLEGGASLGGAGNGAFKGRHSFTDDDLLRARTQRPPVPDGAPQ